MQHTVTAEEIRIQVIATLDGREAEFDVDQIVEECREYGNADGVDGISNVEYWEIVFRHMKEA